MFSYFNSAKTRIYKQNKHTRTQSGAENALSQFWLLQNRVFSYLSRGNEKLLSVSRTVIQLIMRVHKTFVAYKSALQ